MLGKNFWARAPESDCAAAFYEFSNLHPLSDFDRAYQLITKSERWLRPATMRESILEKLESRTPASFIRISDGEGDIVALAHQFGSALPLIDYAVRQISYIHFGDFGVIDRDRSFFAKFIADAAEAADVIGIPAFSTITSDFNTADEKKDVRGIFGKRIAMLYAEQLFAKRPELRFADVWYSRYLLAMYGEFFKAARRICVISTYAELPGRLANAFSLNPDAVHFIPVPKQAIFTQHSARKDTGHFPEGMKAIVSAIPHSDGTTLVLVAGGLLGKFYCTIAKERGCIALDIGSIAEVWMGLKARDFSADFLEKWRLPEVGADAAMQTTSHTVLASRPSSAAPAELIPPAVVKGAAPLKAAAVSKWLSAERPKLRVAPNEVDRLYTLHADYARTGCDVTLEDGEYLIGQTVKIPSNTTIIGAGIERTKITLLPHSNCHIFTNADHKDGNTNIFCSQFSVAGNGGTQSKPAEQKGLTFAGAFYLRSARSVIFTNLSFHDIRQTALHFNHCRNVVIKNVAARKLGWSGISSSEASNLWIEAAEVDDAGRDVMHSAIHLDGGTGIYVDANVSQTTGNGIMLDSAFAPLRNCVVKGTARTCRRGVSLSGSSNHPMEAVVISCETVDNREVGILVSNSAYVTIMNSRVVNNGQYGILFQGRNGGNNSVVVDTHVEGHEVDIGEIHASHSNWTFTDPISDDDQSTPSMNLKHLTRRFGSAEDWFS